MMKLMHHIFQDMLGTKIFYLDDILIFRKTIEDHIETIRKICHRLRKHKLFVNRNKSAFLPEKISVLGRVLTASGIIAAPEKLHKVKNWEIPQTRKQLQGFMGMVNYLSRYIPRLSTYAAPLTHLCGSKVSWNWRNIHTKSFEQVKDILAAEAMLKPLDYDSKEPTDIPCHRCERIWDRHMDWSGTIPALYALQNFTQGNSMQHNQNTIQLIKNCSQ